MDTSARASRLHSRALTMTFLVLVAALAPARSVFARRATQGRHFSSKSPALRHSVAAINSSTQLPPCPASGFDKHTAKYQDYVIRTIRANVMEEYPGCLEVRKAGVVVYRESRADQYGIGNGFGGPEIPVINIGTDVTGGGIPDAIVWSWSGGTHCCLKFQVLQLGNRFSDVADIDAKDSGDAHFADLRHNGHYEFVGRDWTFAYWNASFIESPAPEIILKPVPLRLSKGPSGIYYNYSLDLDLMRRPAPTAVGFESVVRELRPAKWQEYGVPPQLWGSMLNLIYTGHPGLAWKLLGESWPKGRPGREGFLGASCDQLAHSQYFDDLGPLLKNAPADCTWWGPPVNVKALRFLNGQHVPSPF